MKKLVGSVMILALSSFAGEASAKTFSLGVLPAGGMGALQGLLQEKTHGRWARVGSDFATSDTFSDLAAGKYRFDVIGFVPAHYGHYAADISVAAVPEADTWMMLLIGGGMVAYQLRRKQKSLPRQPIAPMGSG